MEKRLLLAIVLSILVLIGYNYYTGKFVPQKVTTPETAQPAETPQSVIEPEISKPLPQPAVDEQAIIVETDTLKVVFTNIGGAIKEIYLKKYKNDGLDGYQLVDMGPAEPGILAIEGLDPGRRNEFSAYSFEKTPTGVIFQAQTSDAWQVKKEYILHNNRYDIELQLVIHNTSGSEKQASYKIIATGGINNDSKLYERYVSSDIAQKEISRINKSQVLKSKVIVVPGETDWVSLKNRYFCLITKPFLTTASVELAAQKDKNIISKIGTQDFLVPARSSVKQQYFFYAGPMDEKILKQYGDIADLTKVIDYGKLSWLCNILMVALRFLHTVFRNWGVAIIFLTAIVSVALYPLTLKSFKSMKAMQDLQPHMDRVKKEFKSDPQKMNKEIMELYKKHKINPLGGCLPLILQMPIFFAIYQLLIKTIELKDAKFLWIKDLSAPDKIIQFKSALPLVGKDFNILPILAAIVMVAQQKFSQAKKTTDDMQKMMTLIMPVMILVFFYNFPAGFVLYFLTSSTMSALFQYRIMRQP